MIGKLKRKNLSFKQRLYSLILLLLVLNDAVGYSRCNDPVLSTALTFNHSDSLNNILIDKTKITRDLTVINIDLVALNNQKEAINRLFRQGHIRVTNLENIELTIDLTLTKIAGIERKLRLAESNIELRRKQIALSCRGGELSRSEIIEFIDIYYNKWQDNIAIIERDILDNSNMYAYLVKVSKYKLMMLKNEYITSGEYLKAKDDVDKSSVQLESLKNQKSIIQEHLDKLATDRKILSREINLQ